MDLGGIGHVKILCQISGAVANENISVAFQDIGMLLMEHFHFQAKFAKS